MLNSAGHEDVSFCICDPDQKDCPIVFASDGFCNFTGYAVDEIEGRNCRFLQGPGTEKADVDKIRSAVKNEKEDSVNLLNYKKDGTSFNNEFFLSPLYGKDGKLKYYIGVQCSVKKLGPGQAPANPGKWCGIVIRIENNRTVSPCRLCARMRWIFRGMEGTGASPENRHTN